MKPDAEIRQLKEEIEECKQDSEAYLDSAQHNNSVALAYKEANEGLTKEVTHSQWALEHYRETLQWYKNYSAQNQKDIGDLQKKISKLRFDPDKKDARLAALSEGWLGGWEAACCYNELSEEDACTGKTFHADYDELARENAALKAEVARLEDTLDY